MPEDLNTAKDLLALAAHVLAGELALKVNDPDEALRELRAAVAAEDALKYSEAADWLYPTRDHLGRALLAAGRAAEAEIVYREDLARYPESGWALFGLAKSLRAQGRPGEAAAVERRFRRAWSKADVTLAASAF